MKNIYLLLLLTSLSVSSWAQTDFYKQFDDAGIAGSLFYTCSPAPTGYVFAGGSSALSFDSHFLIARTSATGVVQQIVTYPVAGYNRISGVIPTIDGKLAYAAELIDAATFAGQLTLFKSDIVGNISWIKSFSSAGYSFNSRSVCQDAAGNYYMVGTASNTSTFINNVCVIKVDASGNLVDQKLVSLGTSFSALDIISTSGNGILICGYADNGTSIETAGLVKLDTNLNVIWSKWLSDPGLGYFVYDMKERQNGNLVLCGRYINNIDPYAVMLLEMDNNGNILWSNKYSGSQLQAEQAYSLVILPDGSILATGEANQNVSGGQTHVIVLNADGSTGNLNWSKIIVSNNTYETVYDVQLTAAGDIITAGSRSGYAAMIKTNTQFDMCADNSYPMTASAIIPVINPLQATAAAFSVTSATPSLGIASFTTLSDACLGVGFEDDMEKLNTNVFPSPASDVVTISHDKNSELTVTAIYDITGRFIKPEIIENNSGSVSIAVSKLNEGIYFAEVNTNDTLKRIKFVVAH
ncbi:MAG: T9SS type A sorting domain-containing protein [Bacteroidia bacterium]|nr:T9SS type A sorting domain-containing protein [Bacteroidia bacterium]